MIDFDIAALCRIGLNNPIAVRLALRDRGLPARVAAVHRTSLVLHDGLHEFPARLLPSPGVTPAVGDWALFDRNAHGEAWIHTLVDPLNELARRDTGGVRKGDDRGRHTATSRSLHLCAGGACVIDTPGLRTWQPDADEDDVNAAFDDIDALAAHCRFHDCSHVEEPGCAKRR